MSFEYSQEVINDYEKLFETDERYDVIIYAGENENVKEIHALSNILCIRSQYFLALLSNELTKKKDGKFILNFPNISPQLFKIILRFIYYGKVDLEKLQGSDVLKLLIIVEEFKLQTLVLCIQEYLIKHQHKFLQQNPIEIFETVYQHEALTDLLNRCLEKICAEPDMLFKSNKFINLKAPLLELLLKRDDLSLDEIDIWDRLIKWCCSQHPSIQQDVKKWNKEETVIMERTIHRFIPLIRFYHIPSVDFMSKVYPFKKVIPEDLIDNILTFHMVQDKQLNLDTRSLRKPKCDYDSIIINNKHFATFSSWIERKNQFHYNEKNIPYNFNLLYRASRDGNTTAAFHAKCDNKGATIIVVKVANSEQIVGGYNPFFWDTSNTYKSTYDSFLFSFINKNSHQSAKVGYSNGDQQSIGCFSYNGAQFGAGCDLYLNHWIWYCNKNDISSYPDIGIPEYVFKADEYEVFQVVKK
ncbi:hypothetical protein RclHR1_11970001 [Rhizophagus clarus]|uniref:BTB/POZ domain-containing protein n=1 Tax=Rhizophagus clarus TaxID=94130 RepID=A0A2Z6Q781_9GLOM|nr:hypothetical protein RclHR1_11970001 [Rhizophagus clarus]GES85015.1 BTB/POZ domain-containing protein [Rhizophagus clarus]